MIMKASKCRVTLMCASQLSIPTSACVFVKKLYKFVPFISSPFHSIHMSILIFLPTRFLYVGRMLEDPSFQNVVSWGPLGDCFVVKV